MLQIAISKTVKKALSNKNHSNTKYKTMQIHSQTAQLAAKKKEKTIVNGN